MVRSVLATGLCLLALGASAAEQPAGARLRGRLHFLNDANNWAPWVIVDSDNSAYLDAYASALVFDVGTPHTLSGLGIYPRDSASLISRSHNTKVYGSNDTNDFKAVLLFNSGSDLTAGKANWLDAQAELKPYRYYRIEPGTPSFPNFHIQFYSADPQVTLEPCQTWSSSALGGADATGGTLFTGKVAYLPDGGTGVVRLMVARADHGDDYATWAADSTCVTVESAALAQGATYSLRTGDGGETLAAGRWFGRTFLDYGGKKTAAQNTCAFVVGTSAYYPAAYFGVGSTAALKQSYDGSLSSRSDSNVSPQRIVFTPDDIDREIVAVRYWPRPEFGTRARCLNARLLASASDGNFGAVTEIGTSSGHVHREAELDPVSDYQQFFWICHLDFWSHGNLPYFEFPVTLPFRHTRYVKIDNFVQNSFFEIEFRTLPRPATPEATMVVNAVGGSYVGLSGYLDYRGNGSTNCDVYAACTKEGETPDYKRVVTGWENETAWSGTIPKLLAETAYTVSVIVSNQTTGVEVLSTNVTTGVYKVEPPEVSLITVTPDSDGSVLFAWNAVTLGTDADTCDLFVSWGADAEHQETPVKLTTISQTGAGAASLDTMPHGTNLVFVLTPKNDQDNIGESTQSGVITLPGASALESATLSRGGASSIAASGRIATVGLGTTDVYINWGETENAFDHWQKIASIDASSVSLAFSGTADAGSAPQVWARIVISNAFKATSWVSASDVKGLLLGTSLPANITVLRSLSSASSFAACAHQLWDGSATTLGDYYAPYDFDFGSSHVLSGVRVAFRSDAWYWGSDTLSVWISNDGVNFTCAWSNETGVAIEAARGKIADIMFPQLPTARFACVTTRTPSQCLDLSECVFMTKDITVSAYETRTWGSAALAPTAHDDRYSDIYFSGKLGSAGSAHVYGCVAQEDYREDLAAWQAHGRVVDLGEHSAGDSVSGTLTRGAPGIYRTRLVAVSGNQAACSPEVQIVPLNTRLYDGPAYMEATRVGVMKVVYDGANNANPDQNPASPVLFKLDSRRRPVAIRFWPRPDVLSRPSGVRIAATTDTSELVATDYCQTPRPIKTFTSNTLTGWKDVGNVTYRGDLMANSSCWDIPLQNLPKDATYLKVYNVENNNYREVEVRVVPVAGFALTVR